jgi:hypothetical protein
MKRGIYDTDHESFRASVRIFLDHEVRPSWDQYIEAKQLPGRCGWPSAVRGCSVLRSPSSTAVP